MTFLLPGNQAPTAHNLLSVWGCPLFLEEPACRLPFSILLGFWAPHLLQLYFSVSVECCLRSVNTAGLPATAGWRPQVASWPFSWAWDQNTAKMVKVGTRVIWLALGSSKCLSKSWGNQNWLKGRWFCWQVEKTLRIVGERDEWAACAGVVQDVARSELRCWLENFFYMSPSIFWG